MLNPCLFVILLLIGYFFIDKKTKNELINKCKKNKFFIFGGLLLIYFLFLKNNIEGFSTDVEYSDRIWTNFSTDMCYDERKRNMFVECGADKGLEDPNWEGGTDCLLWMLSAGNNESSEKRRIISSILTREEQRDGVDQYGTDQIQLQPTCTNLMNNPNLDKVFQTIPSQEYKNITNATGLSEHLAKVLIPKIPNITNTDDP